MSYGICNICGCTDDGPCYHPVFGTCWWLDETHELCSHCIELAGGDPKVEHIKKPKAIRRAVKRKWNIWVV